MVARPLPPMESMGWDTDALISHPTRILNVQLNPAAQEQIAQSLNHFAVLVLCRVPYLEPSVQDTILARSDANLNVRQNLCCNPNLRVDLMERFVAEGGVHERVALARNLSLPVPLQERLVVDETVDVRCALAENESCDREIQLLNAISPALWVRVGLAHNESILPEAQEILVKDSESRVRAALAANTSITLETQQVLSKDRSAGVMTALAANSKLFLDVLVTLTFSQDEVIENTLMQLGTIRFHPRMAYRFADVYFPDEVDEHMEHFDLEALHSLGKNWNGSVDALVEAYQLTLR